MALELLLLSAHLLGDFPLQPTWMAKEKINDARIRAVHVTIQLVIAVVFVTLANINLTSPTAFFISYAATHFFIDSRRWGQQRDDFPAWQFVLDQVFHVTAIAWCVVLFA